MLQFGNYGGTNSNPKHRQRHQIDDGDSSPSVMVANIPNYGAVIQFPNVASSSFAKFQVDYRRFVLVSG